MAKIRIHKNSKHFFRKDFVIYLFPAVLMIGILIFFESMFQYFDQSYYNAVFKQQVLKLNSIVGEVRQLKDMGFTEERDRQIYVEVLNMAVSKIDSEEGIYARLLNTNFKVLSEVVIAEEDRQAVDLFDNKNLHPDFTRVSQLMRNNTRGESTISDGSSTMKIYWVQLPQDNPKYYIIVGVDFEYVLSNYKALPFELGILSITLLLMAMNYYILFLRTKLKQLNRCQADQSSASTL